MKKYIKVLLSLVMAFSLCACADKQDETIEAVEDEAKKTLVVYFSWSGNTELMAEYIADKVDGDVFQIEAADAYPDDYNETGDRAEQERDENARPEIKDLPESLDEYDTIFIGYPIWWHTAPMIIGTFLEAYDLSDVDIYPFSQSASMDTSQFDASMDFVRECAPNANVHDGLFVESDDEDGIDEYLNDNNF